MLDDLEKRRVERFDSRLVELTDRSRPLDQRLRQMVDVFIEIAATVPDLLRLLLQDAGEGDERIAVPFAAPAFVGDSVRVDQPSDLSERLRKTLTLLLRIAN